MAHRSIFSDEWRSSLRAQYQHVLRTDDKVTLPSLTAVLQQVGFDEDEQRQLRLAATLHVDDVAEDFVPDLEILAEAEPTEAHPAECLCPDCGPIDESRFDADGQPLPPDPDADAQKSELIVPAVDIEPEEAEPVTFADSLAPPSAEADTAPALEDDVEEQGGNDEAAPLDDPDSPTQNSLF